MSIPAEPSTAAAAPHRLPLGARPLAAGRCSFCVWAPRAERVALVLPGSGREIDLARGERGYHGMVVDNVPPGTRYAFRLDGSDPLPDPASRSQPDGPHGPSEVVSPAFAWTDGAWRGVPLDQYVLYELHVGTYTPEGTFDAIIPHLDDLRNLGITAVELMPVAQFPGGRNWGYDGVGLYAAQNTYGGPDGLRRLADACHARGLALVLDVVYNHLGPEGNYLPRFGPCFTDRYSTPWGRALNFDGEWSDEVRRFFIENALMWVGDFHIDALRLDAVHAIADESPVRFVEELCAAVHRRGRTLGRHVHCIAESAANDARLITAPELGGYGAAAQWSDDFHHALRVTLTGEGSGYYAGYRPLEHLHKVYEHGYAFTGEFDPFRRRRHGSPCRAVPAERFVVFAQNHDQVGNRRLGERLGALVPFEGLKLAAAATILSPFVPLIFMGEEYAEPAPFLYFISHGDERLIEAVRRGRAEEFAEFARDDHDAGGPTPDPQSEETFRRSKLDLSLRRQGRHAALLAFYRALLRLRREHPALASLSKETIEVKRDDATRTLTLRRWTRSGPSAPAPAEALLILHFGDATASVRAPAGRWRLLLDSGEDRFADPRADRGPPSRPPAGIDSLGAEEALIPPRSVALYDREDL